MKYQAKMVSFYIIIYFGALIKWPILRMFGHFNFQWSIPEQIKTCSNAILALFKPIFFDPKNSLLSQTQKIDTKPLVHYLAIRLISYH